MSEIYGGGTIKRDRRLQFCVPRRRQSLTRTKQPHRAACANDPKNERLTHTHARVFITRNCLSITFIIGIRPVIGGYRRRPIGSVDARQANRHTVRRRATLISKRGMCLVHTAYGENGSFRRVPNDLPKDTRPWTCAGGYHSFNLYNRYHYRTRSRCRITRDGYDVHVP